MKKIDFLGCNLLKISFHKLFYAFFVSILLSGCATGLKKEVHNLELAISEDKQAIYNAKSWLSNSRAYNGRGCSKPSRGVKPKFSCETKEESREVGLAFCAVSYNGCAAVVTSLGSQLNDEDERFLASDACEQLLANLTGHNRSLVSTFVEGVIETGKESCENGDFFGKVFGCPTYLAGEIVKFSEFSNCVNNKTEECYNNYDNWMNGPSREQRKCEENLALIDSTKRSLSDKTKELRKTKESFMWELFGD